MNTLTLRRLEMTPFATFGQLSNEEDRFVAATLERPWLDNLHDESCIPAGTYEARRYHSPKRGYDVFMLASVPDREDIELHIGNTAADSHGCILLGSNFGVVNGQRGITGSAAAFARFMDGLRGVDAFTLVVSDPAPGAA